MALDRRIVIHLEALGIRNQQGIYVPGPVTDYPLWAQRMASGSTDVEDSEGTRVVRIVTWRVRWFAALASHRIDLMSLTAEGYTWNPESVNESDERRRFVDIQSVRQSDG